MNAVEIQQDTAGKWSYVGGVCQLPAKPQVTAELVRQQVVRLIPSAAVGVAPHDATLVNIQTIMWVEAGARKTLAPITLLGHRVVISLALDHVDWTFGDGQSDRSGSAGKVYDSANDPCRAVQCPDYYGHTYRQTGSDTVRATVTWTASFTVDGGDRVAIPGTVAGPTARSPLAVKQARAVLVPDPGGN